ncbi:hypothetical protein DFH08DRAFT_930947 [Mycena albidolilacea]|uniref:Uncharacterized protein n=1 Tax=Mycena albidolilacea TaxID=1033008 RepID=A0AAD7AMG5_9AGAR|nr:hypothetical protein DFH08DRAFT_930947 [Mycena albidolilacea]
MHNTSEPSSNDKSTANFESGMRGTGERNREQEARSLPENPPDTGDSQRERHFVSINNGKPLYVPVMTVAQFCDKYDLSENIRQRLEEEEFKTAGALLEVSEATLQTAGFKSGQIADLKKALKEFLMSNMALAPTGDDR